MFCFCWALPPLSVSPPHSYPQLRGLLCSLPDQEATPPARAEAEDARAAEAQLYAALCYGPLGINGSFLEVS